jgi:hypothetical protein
MRWIFLLLVSFGIVAVPGCAAVTDVLAKIFVGSVDEKHFTDGLSRADRMDRLQKNLDEYHRKEKEDQYDDRVKGFLDDKTYSP